MAIPPPRDERGKEESKYPFGVKLAFIGSCPRGLSQVSVRKTKSMSSSKMKSAMVSGFPSVQTERALNKQIFSLFGKRDSSVALVMGECGMFESVLLILSLSFFRDRLRRHGSR